MIHKTDVVMPAGLMRNPGLVRRLEMWRLGSFTTESLIPGPHVGLGERGLVLEFTGQEASAQRLVYEDAEPSR